MTHFIAQYFQSLYPWIQNLSNEQLGGEEIKDSVEFLWAADAA